MEIKTPPHYFMHIQEIKQNTKQSSLAFVRQMEEDGKTPTAWLSHWDNTNRIRVTAHEEVIARMKENPERRDLAIKTEIVEKKEDREAYTRHIIIIPMNIEYAV